MSHSLKAFIICFIVMRDCDARRLHDPDHICPVQISRAKWQEYEEFTTWDVGMYFKNSSLRCPLAYNEILIVLTASSSFKTAKHTRKAVSRQQRIPARFSIQCPSSPPSPASDSLSSSIVTRYCRNCYSLSEPNSSNHESRHQSLLLTARKVSS